MWPSRGGSACRRAIDSPVRDAGMIVVCVEAIADVATAKSTTQSQPPITCEAISAKTNSSSPALSVSHWVPANATTAKATDDVGDQQDERRPDAPPGPGALAPSVVSSLRLTADSQPQ